MGFIRTFARVLRSLRSRIARADKITEEGSKLAQEGFLRPSGGQVSWDKLEREAKVVSMRGWPLLQEREANDSNIVVPDREIRRLCKAYANSTSSQRAVLRSRVSIDLASALDHFAWRMAICALRNNSDEAIQLGLTAISIEDMRLDMRETTRWVALLYHAAVRLQQDAERYFQVVASMSSARTSDLINSFLSASPELRDISAFGFGEGTSEQGPTLVKIPLSSGMGGTGSASAD